MTSLNKAHAGGVAGLISAVLWQFLVDTPTVMHLTMNQQSALETILAAAIGWVVVYLGPPNAAQTTIKTTVTADDPIDPRDR